MLYLFLGGFCSTPVGAAPERGPGQAPPKVEREGPQVWSRPRVDISGHVSLPEAWGLEILIQPMPQLGFWFAYAPALPLRVNYLVPGRRLVEASGVAIRSPDLSIPFDLEFGPHRGGGISYFPFAGAFYLSLGFQRRSLRIAGEVDSQLLFADETGQSASNSLFHAEVRSQTEQRILRLSLGHRWSFWSERLSFGWYLGFSRPMVSHSEVKAEVRVLNPQASDPSEGVAPSLNEAETLQAEHMQGKAKDFLGKYEWRTLPLLGLSLGLKI